MLEKLITDSSSIILTALVTLIVAYVKKRIDLKKMRRQGILKDRKYFESNGVEQKNN